MRWTRLAAVMLLAALFGAVSLSAEAPSILSLEEAVNLALEHNRGVRNAVLEVEKSDHRSRVARTHYRPSFDIYALGSVLLTPIDFEFGRGVFGNYAATGPIPAVDTAIRTDAGETTAVVVGTLSQPLSQLRRIGLGVEAAEVGEEIAHERLRAQRQTVVSEVRRSYYAALQARSALEARTDEVEFYRELARVVSDFVREDLALRAESLEVEARLARAEYEILSLQNRLRGIKEELNRLMGRDVRVDFELAPTDEAISQVPAASDLALEAARARALAQRPEAREARLRARQAELDRRIKKSERVPDVSFTLDYLSAFDIDPLPSNVARASVLLNWEPFDWRRRRHEIDERDRSLEQARNGVGEAESAILMEVGDRFRSLQESRALVAVTEAGRTARRERRRLVMDRYGQQEALLRDVLEAQSQLSAAEDEWQRSRLASWMAAAELERAMGEER